MVEEALLVPEDALAALRVGTLVRVRVRVSGLAHWLGLGLG